MDEIVLLTSRKKHLLLLGCVILSLAVSLWVGYKAENFEIFSMKIPAIIIYTVVAIAVLFLIFAFVLSLKRIIKPEIAYIINENGLNVSPKHLLSEYIEWNQIESFGEYQVNNHMFILILVKDPQHWIDNETSLIKKKTMQFSLNNYRTPFTISSSIVDKSHAELLEILNNYLRLSIKSQLY